jgi:hypothetical protein
VKVGIGVSGFAPVEASAVRDMPWVRGRWVGDGPLRESDLDELLRPSRLRTRLYTPPPGAQDDRDGSVAAGIRPGYIPDSYAPLQKERDDDLSEDETKNPDDEPPEPPKPKRGTWRLGRARRARGQPRPPVRWEYIDLRTPQQKREENRVREEGKSKPWRCRNLDGRPRVGRSLLCTECIVARDRETNRRNVARFRSRRNRRNRRKRRSGQTPRKR